MVEFSSPERRLSKVIWELMYTAKPLESLARDRSNAAISIASTDIVAMKRVTMLVLAMHALVREGPLPMARARK